ncbi:MAG: hypothetical protein IH604_08065 [Burkholderiales bacterium]|nr:hypothetical protein [Burkholderiales bacterium]
MFKYLAAAGSLILLLAVSLPCKSDTLAIPSVKSFPSSVGEVTFTHEMHIKDRGIQCVECHHSLNAKPLGAPRTADVKSSSAKCPINVKTLNTPHPDYFKSSSIKCAICHIDSDTTKESAYTCSGCHRTNPVNIADETLSSKVVVHKQCWKCHQVGVGKEAGSACEKCHSGEKTLDR